MNKKIITIGIICTFLGVILLPSITAEQIDSKPCQVNYYIKNQIKPSGFKSSVQFNLTFYGGVYWMGIFSGWPPKKVRFLAITDPSGGSTGPIAKLTYGSPGDEQTVVFQIRLIVSISISDDTYQRNLTVEKPYYDPDGGFVSGFAFSLFYLGS